MENLNVREKFVLMAAWYGWQNEILSDGLKSIDDAIKLYEYWQANGDNLPEFADEDYDDDNQDIADVREKLLGYDPMYVKFV